MHVMAIIQARMGSTRLPDKVLRPLAGRAVLGWVIRAAQLSEAVDTVVVATSTEASDDPIVDYCAQLGVPCVRGSEEDVLDRFLVTLKTHPAEVIMRLTADCPMLDPAVITHTVGAFISAKGSADYLSTVVVRCLPRGLDIEVFSADALRRVAEFATGYHRTHVTSAIYTNPNDFAVAGLVFTPNASDLRITLDTPEDAALLEALAAEIGDKAPAWRDVVSLLRERPALVALNAAVRQKELAAG